MRAVGARRVEALAVADPRHRPGERAGGDHEVERDEQVRGRAARLDRDAERQRGQRGQRQERARRRANSSASGIDDERGDDERGRPAPAAGARARRRAAASPRSTTTSSTGVSASAPSIAQARAGRRAREDRRGGERRREHDPDRADPRARPRCRSGAIWASEHQNERIRGRRAAQDVGDVAGQLLHRAPSRRAAARPTRAARRGSRCRRRPACSASAGQASGSGSSAGSAASSAVDGRPRRSATRTRSDGSDSSSVGEARQLLDAGQQAGVALVGDRLRAARATPSRRDGRSASPNGSVSVGGSGRSSRSRATATPRRSDSAPNDATRPPSVDVAAQPPRERRSGSSASARRAARPRARP